MDVRRMGLSRLQWLAVSVFLGGILLLGMILFQAAYVALRESNRQLQAQTEQLQGETARLNAKSTAVEDAILAKMRRGIPVHPSGKSPLFEEPLKQRAVPVMIEQLRDPRHAVVAYTLHDLTEILSQDADPSRFAPQLVPALLPLIEDDKARVRSLIILRQLKADPRQVISHVTATIDNFLSVMNAAVWSAQFDPSYDTMPLYVDFLQHHDVEETHGKFLLKNAIQNRLHTWRDFEMALKKALLDVDDRQERARLNQWIEFVQEQF